MNKVFSIATVRVIVFLVLFSQHAINCAMAQGGYKLVLPSDEYQSITDMRFTANGEMHIAASHFVYRLNSAGDITRQVSVKEGSYSELRAAIPQPDGSDLLLLYTLELPDADGLLFYKLGPTGTLSGRKEIPANEISGYTQMKTIAPGRQLVTYKKRIDEEEYVVWGICLNSAGEVIWEKALTGSMYNYYSVIEQNEGIELMYRKEGAIGASLVRISPEGILETMDFEFSAEITAGDHLNEFVKLPDGSYFLGGSRVYLSDKNEDIILVKTTATGKEISVNRLDIQMGDWVRHMHATADGLLLLGMSGRSSLNDLNKGDLLVVKTDLDGSEMWRRAFASPVADIGYFISSLNENIYVAARMGVTGNSLTTPVVMQLDNLGHLPDDFPFSLAENSEIKTLNTGINDNLQVLSDAIAGSDNNIILGINRLDHEYDNWLPYVVASDTSGDIDWELNLPPHYGEIKVLSRIRPNDNLVITEIRDIFTNLYYVTQFNDEGKIGWTYETGASHMRTAIRTRDGGYLLVGDVDISFVNYDVQITKLDEKGVQLWQKTIGVHGKWEMPRCVAETPEGDLIIAGTSLKEFDEVSVLYALRITQTGQVQWQRELGLGIVEENAFTIVHTTDGNYMVGGFYHTQPLDNRNVMLAKFDGSGQLLSKKTFNLHHHDAIQSMIPKANGGYIAVGNNSGYQWGTWQQRGFVLQVSEDGIATNSTFYGPASQHLSFQKLLVTTSNDTLLLGNYQPFYGYSRPFYLKVQTNRSEPLPLYPKDPYIFPNPSLGSSRLRWISPDEGLLKIQVYNSNGQLCFSTVDHKLAGLYQYELPQLKAVAGIYFVRLEIGKFVRTLKWIKQ